jgi:hypothetical protein
MSRALGKNQRGCLESLVQFGTWIEYPGSWTWDTRANTRRILDSLARRGLAKPYRHRITPSNGRPFSVDAYHPTQAGRDLVA